MRVIDIQIVFERFITAPVDGKDAYNSFAEYFELQRNGNAPRGSSTMDNFEIAVNQYEMRAYLAPDHATTVMNLVLRNLAVARRLGLEYIHLQDPRAARRYHRSNPSLTVPSGSAPFDLFWVGPSRTVSDARAALEIDGTVEFTVDVVEDAFENTAVLIVADGERNVEVTRKSITALKNLRQAQSLLLRSLE
jgi:hypothetical protein